MKPVDKKDMPKLIALIGLTVCSLGFGIYQLVGSTSVAAPPADATSKEGAKTPDGAAPQGGAAPANGAAPQGGAPPADDVLIAQMQRLETVTEPLFIRDPFVAAKAAPGTATATQATPPPTPITPGLPGTTSASPEEARRDLAQKNWAKSAENLKGILGLTVKTKKPAGEGLLDNPSGRPAGFPGGPAPAPSGPLELPPPAPPTLTISGILVAEEGEGKSIAIVRINDHSRWLSVGDSVGNGFVVRSIRKTDRGSELEIVDSTNKKRSFTFQVN